MANSSDRTACLGWTQFDGYSAGIFGVFSSAPGADQSRCGEKKWHSPLRWSTRTRSEFWLTSWRPGLVVEVLSGGKKRRGYRRQVAGTTIRRSADIFQDGRMTMLQWRRIGD